MISDNPFDIASARNKAARDLTQAAKRGPDSSQRFKTTSDDHLARNVEYPKGFKGNVCKQQSTRCQKSTTSPQTTDNKQQATTRANRKALKASKALSPKRASGMYLTLISTEDTIDTQQASVIQATTDWQPTSNRHPTSNQPISNKQPINHLDIIGKDKAAYPWNAQPLSANFHAPKPANP